MVSSHSKTSNVVTLGYGLVKKILVNGARSYRRPKRDSWFFEIED